MREVATEIAGCAEGERVVVVDFRIEEAGQVVGASVSDELSPVAADCVLAAAFRVVLPPFCLADGELFVIRYPFRLAEPSDPPDPDDAGVEDTDGGVEEGTGVLRINSRPWSQVYVDGRLIGNTPQLRIELAAGDHVVRLVNPEFGLERTITITIVAGEALTQVITLG